MNFFLGNAEKQVATRKRKRDESESLTQPPRKHLPSLKDFMEPKQVFCFVRRCLIHVLDVDMKAKKVKRKYEQDCPLLGGKANFDCLVRKL